MPKLCILLIMFGLVLVGATVRARVGTGENVDVRAGINRDDFNSLLKKYVDDHGLVNYGGWKQNAADLAALDNYLKEFAAKIETPAQGNEKAASLINAYNALVLQWILKNYPTESAKALYAHVLGRMRYDKSGTGWGRGDAVYACDAKTGNCSDFHAYFIALARSIDIPARFAIGATIPAEKNEGVIEGYHWNTDVIKERNSWPHLI